jgi:hypothetical protein
MGALSPYLDFINMFMIFAAIEAHREAILAYDLAIDEEEKMEPDEFDAWSGAASQRKVEALQAVLTIPPTTFGGVVAFSCEARRSSTRRHAAWRTTCHPPRGCPHRRGHARRPFHR